MELGCIGVMFASNWIATVLGQLFFRPRNFLLLQSLFAFPSLSITIGSSSSHNRRCSQLNAPIQPAGPT